MIVGFVVVATVVLVLIFVFAQNSPRTADESYYDGIQSAPLSELPGHPNEEQIEAACAKFFSYGPGVVHTARSGIRGGLSV